MSLKKKNRLETICRIIKADAYDNQDDLLKALEKEGFVTTQATLSRDLRDLNVKRKVEGNKGRGVFVIYDDSMLSYGSYDEQKAYKIGLKSVEFSGNMVVIKTRTGYANSLATEIDALEEPKVLGSVAGDDTIFLVLRESADREVIFDMINKILNNI